MTSPSSDNQTISTKSVTRIRSVIVALFSFGLLSALLGGGWYFYRAYRATGTALTTAELIVIAKTTAPNDRPAWLRLARAILAAESVKAIASPEEPINNRGEFSRVELGYLLFFDPILSGERNTS